MQFDARNNYFCSIRDYVTGLNDRRYPNPTILLLARTSGKFYSNLELFKIPTNLEANKEILSDIEYPSNEREDFLLNANVKMYKEYYWTYYEKRCPVHCIFLDKLKLLFE